MMRDHVCGHGSPGEEKKRQRQRKRQKWIQKEQEEHSLSGGQKKTLLGGPKERKARKAFQKAMNAFRKVGFSDSPTRRRRARISSSIKTEEAKEALILNLDFQPQKHPVKKDFAVPGSQTTGLPATGFTSLQPQLLGGLARELILHGWRQSL